jgi:DNA-binding transcriptional LysR family regulator
MNLRQLEHFVAVAEERNFTRAARRVCIAQSALSTSIRGLEEQLGGALLHRSPRHVALTPTGEVMLEWARTILAEVRAAREAVAGVQGRLSGTLSICAGIMASIKPYIDLPLLMARFRGDHAGVELRLREIPAAGVREAFRRHEVEIAIVSKPNAIPDGFRTVPLATDRYKLVCRTDHRLARRKTVRPGDISGEMFVCLNREFAVRREADAYLERADIEWHLSCEVNGLTALCELVALGLGVTILPSRIAEYRAENSGVRDLSIVELSPRGPSYDICALVADDRPGGGKPRMGAAARAFLAMLAADTSVSIVTS